MYDYDYSDRATTNRRIWEKCCFDYPDPDTKFNPFHHPAGAPGGVGGQFAPADGRGGGGGSRGGGGGSIGGSANLDNVPPRLRSARDKYGDPKVITLRQYRRQGGRDIPVGGYVADKRTIVLDDSWKNDQILLDHEWGHYLDNQIGGGRDRWWSSQGKVIRAWRGDLEGVDFSDPAALRSRITAARKADLAPLEEALYGPDGRPIFSGPGVAENWAKVGRKTMAWKEFDNFMGAATRNQVGQAHPTEYYVRRGPVGQTKEMFAYRTSLEGIGEDKPLSMLKGLFPSWEKEWLSVTEEYAT